MKIYHIASAILRRGNDVLLVQQPSDDGLYWMMPGGYVEDGELLHEAIIREIKEETNLDVHAIDNLVSISNTRQLTSDLHSYAFTFEVTQFSGTIDFVHDPDELIHDARFFSIDDALVEMESIPWQSLREPAIRYLRGETPAGMLYQYQHTTLKDFTLVSTLPSLAY